MHIGHCPLNLLQKQMTYTSIWTKNKVLLKLGSFSAWMSRQGSWKLCNSHWLLICMLVLLEINTSTTISILSIVFTILTSVVRGSGWHVCESIYNFCY